MSRNWIETPLGTTVASVTVAGGIALVITLLTSIPSHGPAARSLPSQVELLIRMEVFFTTLNLVLLVALAVVYWRLYRDLPNKYTASLLVLSLALLLYAFTSNPLIHDVLGFRPRPNIGAFVFIPDLFVGVAILVLLYQSQT
jgi:Kef-type K+ transport system membrane component KefB